MNAIKPAGLAEQPLCFADIEDQEMLSARQRAGDVVACASVVDAEFDRAALEGLEAGLLDEERVATGKEEGDLVGAVVTGFAGGGDAGFDVGDFDGGSGNVGSRGVGNVRRAPAQRDPLPLPLPLPCRYSEAIPFRRPTYGRGGT